MADGITTHIDRVPADAGLAARQHEAYVDAVAGAGWTIREVPPADGLPDSAFLAGTRPPGDVITVDIGEFEKREGCVTCLWVLVADRDACGVGTRR